MSHGFFQYRDNGLMSLVILLLTADHITYSYLVLGLHLFNAYFILMLPLTATKKIIDVHKGSARMTDLIVTVDLFKFFITENKMLTWQLQNGDSPTPNHN